MHVPPGDTLIYPDGILTSLFYIARGSLEILDSEDGAILALLNEGDFIGGVPPLFRPDLPNTSSRIPSLGIPTLPPPAKSRFTVRALTFVDIHYLEREDLAELMALYPEISESFIQFLEFTFPLADSFADWNEQEYSWPNHNYSNIINNNHSTHEGKHDDFVFPHTNCSQACHCNCHREYLEKRNPVNTPPWEMERINRIVNHSGTWFTTTMPEALFDDSYMSRTIIQDIYRRRYLIRDKMSFDSNTSSERRRRRSGYKNSSENNHCSLIGHNSAQEEANKKLSDQNNLLNQILFKMNSIEKEIFRLDSKTNEKIDLLKETFQLKTTESLSITQ